ncbi:MAG: hypothetical protein KGZ39_06430 [Simkania sp.]|nr:hypothetical protein [Simkania sp.]
MNIPPYSPTGQTNFSSPQPYDPEQANVVGDIYQIQSSLQDLQTCGPTGDPSAIHNLCTYINQLQNVDLPILKQSTAQSDEAMVSQVQNIMLDLQAPMGSGSLASAAAGGDASMQSMISEMFGSYPENVHTTLSDLQTFASQYPNPS